MPVVGDPCEAAKMLEILRLRHALRFADRESPLRMTKPALPRSCTMRFHSIPSGSSSPVNLGPPPADADEQETPVAKEFWRLAFEGMADELENPSEDEEG
jgi:hypothetical protein